MFVENASSLLGLGNTAGEAANKTETGSNFADVLSQEAQGSGEIIKPGGAHERTWLWNKIAEERPSLLQSDEPGDNPGGSEGDRADEIKNNLVNAGLDLTTSVIIANREANTEVTRPDNTRPGPGSSGYSSMPESIKSEFEDEGSQIREGTGYAYIDRYGFPHVTSDLATALNFSGDGEVYEYEGKFGGGYALDDEDSRAMLDLPGARMYSNAERAVEKQAEESGEEVENELPGEPEGKLHSASLTEDYIEGLSNDATFSLIDELG